MYVFLLETFLYCKFRHVVWVSLWKFIDLYFALSISLWLMIYLWLNISQPLFKKKKKVNKNTLCFQIHKISHTSKAGVTKWFYTHWCSSRCHSNCLSSQAEALVTEDKMAQILRILKFQSVDFSKAFTLKLF